MKQYENKSQEELRFEDDRKGVKGPGQGGGFGAASTTPMFGSNQASTLGGSGFGGFGRANTQTAFGQTPTAFGASSSITITTHPLGGFGLGGSSKTTSAYGSTGAVSQATSFGGFGATSTTPSSSGGFFGQTPNAATPTPSSSFGCFGQTPDAATRTPSSSFGGFGQTPGAATSTRTPTSSFSVGGFGASNLGTPPSTPITGFGASTPSAETNSQPNYSFNGTTYSSCPTEKPFQTDDYIKDVVFDLVYTELLLNPLYDYLYNGSLSSETDGFLHKLVQKCAETEGCDIKAAKEKLFVEDCALKRKQLGYKLETLNAMIQAIQCEFPLTAVSANTNEFVFKTAPIHSLSLSSP